MKKILLGLVVFGLILAISGLAMAGNTATQTVTYQVQAINEISVTSDPGALIVSTAVAGSAPTAVTDVSTTYAITTNETKKITGAINSDMPAGLTLSITLVAPTGGTSAGKKTLTAVAVDLVTGISALNQSGIAITYELAATSAAGVVSSATKTVTLTIAAP